MPMGGSTTPITFKSVQLVDFASATNILGGYDAEGNAVSPAGVCCSFDATSMPS